MLIKAKDDKLFKNDVFFHILFCIQATDVANQISQKHDLGCTSTSQLDIFSESLQLATPSGPLKTFWKLLGADGNATPIYQRLLTISS